MIQRTQLDDFRDILQLGQQMSLEGTVPVTITITRPGESNGREYQASSEGGSMGVKLEEGGEVYILAIAFRVRKSLLPALPPIGSRITCEGVEYKFVRSGTRFHDSAWFLGCESLEASE